MYSIIIYQTGTTAKSVSTLYLGLKFEFIVHAIRVVHDAFYCISLFLHQKRAKFTMRMFLFVYAIIPMFVKRLHQFLFSRKISDKSIIITLYIFGSHSVALEAMCCWLYVISGSVWIGWTKTTFKCCKSKSFKVRFF